MNFEKRRMVGDEVHDVLVTLGNASCAIPVCHPNPDVAVPLKRGHYKSHTPYLWYQLNISYEYTEIILGLNTRGTETPRDG